MTQQAERAAREISLSPLPTEQYLALPERERKLQTIGDVIAYWIKWVATDGLKHEEYKLDPDAYVILGFDGGPPHWPSVGQLTHWLEVIRSGANAAMSPQAFTRASVLEEAARLVEAGQETWSTQGGSDSTFLTPRQHGNQMGLAYARAIRALASQPAPAVGDGE